MNNVLFKQIRHHRIQHPLLFLIAGVLYFGIAVNCFSQSVADIARQERNRQQAAQSKVVITSIGKTKASETATPPAPDKAEAASTQTATAKPLQITDTNGRDEKFWRAAFAAARENLKRAEAKVQLQDLHLKDLNTQLLRDSQVYNREYRLGGQITTAQKELDDAKKEVEAAKKKISDLEDELRRSGGLPGWAR